MGIVSYGYCIVWMWLLGMVHRYGILFGEWMHLGMQSGVIPVWITGIFDRAFSHVIHPSPTIMVYSEPGSGARITGATRIYSVESSCNS